MVGWTKLGLVLEARGTSLERTHAMLPSPDVRDDCVRVYFTSCDEDLRGRIFSVDLDKVAPRTVLRRPVAAVLELGENGAFDADGVNPSQLLLVNGAQFLYYIGWKRRDESVPYTLFAGLAISEDDGRTFRRVAKSPILPPTNSEAYFRTAPHVHAVSGGWAMYYIGGGAFFTSRAGKRLPLYGLCRSYSKDGISWSGGETLMRPNVDAGEIGFGRPFLWRDCEGRRCLYISVRTEAGYTLCSFPDDGRQIEREKAHCLVPVSSSGWDSEMTCFGAPYSTAGSEFLFYNGNQFGRTGFGVATRRCNN